MTTHEYFEEQLKVSFTMHELYAISSALATEAFKEREEHRNNNAEEAFNIRKKVLRFVELYNQIYK